MYQIQDYSAVRDAARGGAIEAGTKNLEEIEDIIGDTVLKMLNVYDPTKGASETTAAFGWAKDKAIDRWRLGRETLIDENGEEYYGRKWEEKATFDADPEVYANFINGRSTEDRAINRGRDVAKDREHRERGKALASINVCRLAETKRAIESERHESVEDALAAVRADIETRAAARELDAPVAVSSLRAKRLASGYVATGVNVELAVLLGETGFRQVCLEPQWTVNDAFNLIVANRVWVRQSTAQKRAEFRIYFEMRDTHRVNEIAERLNVSPTVFRQRLKRWRDEADEIAGAMYGAYKASRIETQRAIVSCLLYMSQLMAKRAQWDVPEMNTEVEAWRKVAHGKGNEITQMDAAKYDALIESNYRWRI